MDAAPTPRRYRGVTDPHEAVSARVRTLLKTSQTKKPPGYDDDHARRRAHYEGDGWYYNAQRIAAQYPNSAARMHSSTPNLMAAIAAIDASVYRRDPARTLVDPLTKKETGNEAARKMFDTIVEHFELATVMTDFERMVHIADTVFARVDEDAIRLFWPSDVHVVPNWRTPEKIQECEHIFFRSSGPEGPYIEGKLCHWWEWWTPLLDGTERVGWTVRLVCEDGREDIESARVHGSPLLPVAVWINGPMRGSVFITQQKDLCKNVEAICAATSNLLHIIDQQAHGQVFVFDDSDGDNVIAAAPGIFPQLRKDARVEVVNYGAQIGEVRHTVNWMKSELAIARRQSPNAYNSAGPTGINTGPSMAHRSAPQESKFEEMQNGAKMLEVKQLLPILLDVGGRLFNYTFGALKPKCVPQNPPTYENPTDRTERYRVAYENGWVNKATAAAKSLPDLYSNPEDARRQIDGLAPTPSVDGIDRNPAQMKAADVRDAGEPSNTKDDPE